MDEAFPFPLSSQESMLRDYAGRLDRYRAGRVAMHVHLSRLAPAYSHEPYIRIASEAFTSSIQAFEGQLFMLPNLDMVFIARDATVTMLDAALNKLRVLFTEDPVPSGLCSWYELETEYDAFIKDIDGTMRESALERQNAEFPPGFNPASLLSPIRPEILTKLELSLAKTDVSSIVRRQIVSSMADAGRPQPLFEEIFVLIEDLQGIATPGVDLRADKWLFRYLTHTLDKRVMAMLINEGINTTRPFSINLNIATLLSPEFARFAAIVKPQLRGRMVIELDRLDVFADMGAFLFARDYLHDHGFRICLDGMTHHTLPFFDRAKLGFDLVKLYWTPDGIDTMPAHRIPELRGLVMDTGQARTILCRCDNERAVEMGQSLGIVMFQGRHIDRLLGATRLSPPASWGMLTT